ncbi:MAG: hypothetical protein LAQ30_01625 [Acidobacteriia bacterium]|nr:hypothetical protein [Terriglobia bacterium]
MIRNLPTTPRSCLGCAGVPNCPGPTAGGCPSARATATLGAFSLPSVPFDIGDWKLWAMAALAIALVYQLLFRGDQRKKRSARRGELRQAADRYSAEITRIREKYA